MLDVHAPHATVHTWKDFFIHITIITIGLLIASNLGLNGAGRRARCNFPERSVFLVPGPAKNEIFRAYLS